MAESEQTEGFICEKKIGKLLAGPWSSWLWRRLDMAEIMRSNRVGPTFAQVAQLGERQTEDLNVPGSSPGLGMYLL